MGKFDSQRHPLEASIGNWSKLRNCIESILKARLEFFGTRHTLRGLWSLRPLHQVDQSPHNLGRFRYISRVPTIVVPHSALNWAFFSFLIYSEVPSSHFRKWMTTRQIWFFAVTRFGHRRHQNFFEVWLLSQNWRFQIDFKSWIFSLCS